MYRRTNRRWLDRVSFAIWLIRRTFVRDRKLRKKRWTTRKNAGGCRLQNRRGLRRQRCATRNRYATSELMKRAARRGAALRRDERSGARERKLISQSTCSRIFPPGYHEGNTLGAIYRCFLRRKRFTRPLPFHP